MRMPKSPIPAFIYDRLYQAYIFALPLIFAGWVTHLYACAAAEDWGFLFLGSLFFPVGAIHGWGIWAGLW